ncbi:unnamed protein product [Fusarium graminearum]|uniref:Uncharacterized protein n=1 Tax=Gibberella zeae TaxID=5518 RepID=A0A4U9ESF9_GIBZA|nr:unnamed protein product [Fusarium graminearum]CAF3453521.1 unnamed protein product [Fusarium graminearum]CAF3580676.1 unnamed protein product [Fusarium graminearum]CAG1961310.1 unnamed protein product [Fusarium graminearum]CAG1973362.1 unnamed protein product [Fusarium graminearum]
MLLCLAGLVLRLRGCMKRSQPSRLSQRCVSVSEAAFPRLVLHNARQAGRPMCGRLSLKLASSPGYYTDDVIELGYTTNTPFDLVMDLSPVRQRLCSS